MIKPQDSVGVRRTSLDDSESMVMLWFNLLTLGGNLGDVLGDVLGELLGDTFHYIERLSLTPHH